MCLPFPFRGGLHMLTREEYEEMTGRVIKPALFTQLLPRAVAVLNNITGYFYVKNDIEEDGAWRAGQFKRALCAQVEYFQEAGAATFEGINKEPQSFTAGRTSVTNVSRFSSGGKNKAKQLVAVDALIHLEGTGLLYAGVSLL